eukprot:COSAG01_NODE_7128_length_3338_cov_1.993825_2_plen_73_part_00
MKTTVRASVRSLELLLVTATRFPHTAGYNEAPPIYAVTWHGRPAHVSACLFDMDLSYVPMTQTASSTFGSTR